MIVLFGFWINLEDQSANIHPDTSIPSVTVEQQPAGRLHRQGARPPDGEQEVGAEEGDRGGGAGGLEGGDDRLLLSAGEGGPERPVNVPEGEGRPEESNRGDAEEIQPAEGSSFLCNIWLKSSISG